MNDTSDLEKSESKRPRVLVCGETDFHRVCLSEIVAQADCEAIPLPPNETLGEFCARSTLSPDLVIVPLYGIQDRSAELEELRRLDEWREVPALGITDLAGSGLDLEELRGVGVVGLVNKAAIPEHVIFRINRVVRPYDSGRRFERAPAFFPVDLEVDGAVGTEYALNLSVGGMALTSARPLEPNTDISIRFWLPNWRSDLIEVRSRVIYCRRSRRRYAPYEMGVFFYPLEPDLLARIDEEVSRLLRIVAVVDD